MYLDTKMEQEDKGNDETLIKKQPERKCTSPYKGTLGSLQNSRQQQEKPKTIQEYIQRGERKGSHQSRAAHSVKKIPLEQE